jgi:enoyl ACP reductase
MILEGKRLLVTGVMTKESLAFHVAREAQLAGAEVLLTSYGRISRITERAARKLPEPTDVLELDVSREEDFAALTRELQSRWDGLDGVVHSIAYGPPDALGGNFMNTPLESAENTFATSAFSLKSLARATRPLLAVRGGSIVGLTFDGAHAWPIYDWMGVAKAALEQVSRYLACYLGPDRIRVNLVSAGPLWTSSSRAIPGFEWFAEYFHKAPLDWSLDDPLPVARTACFLLSDWSSAMTGQVLRVDGGLSAFGRPFEGVVEVARAFDDAYAEETGG